jgi:hypothetical protein
LKFFGYQLSAEIQKNFKKRKKKKTLINIGGPPSKCAYHAFIIQNLDVVALELGMKVQFANFLQTKHTKILAVRQ